MKKIILMLGIVMVLLIGGCVLTPNPVNYEIEDKENMVDNEQECYKLCKQREDNSYKYHCEYEVVCDDGKCLCKTW